MSSIPEIDAEPLIWCRVRPEEPGKLHTPKLPGDVGWDLEASEDVVLSPGQTLEVPTNIRVKLPSCCWGEIRLRSSTVRRGLTVNSNTIDTYYTGELFASIRNVTTDKYIKIQTGERVAQLVLHLAHRVYGVEADFEHSEARGIAGFGSTGI